MAVYRNITGTIKDAQGDLVTSGTIKVKPLVPVSAGSAFVSPEQINVTVTDGLFDLELVAPCVYEFIVLDIYEESMWNFVAVLSDDSVADISLAALYAQSETSLDTEVIITAFLGLVDTPDSFTGEGGQYIGVNPAEDALTFLPPGPAGPTGPGVVDESLKLSDVLSGANLRDVIDNLDTVSALKLSTTGVQIVGDTDTQGLTATNIQVSGQVTTESIQLDTAGSTPLGEGHLSWNPLDKTMNIHMGGPVLQPGQETVVRVFNDTGVPITNGTIVSNAGSINGRPSASLADATIRQSSRATLGVATEDIFHGLEGTVTTYGLVRGVNTAAFFPGSPLFLHESVPGTLQGPSQPSPPISVVFIGVCLVQDGTNGVIFVEKVVEPLLTELVDVDVTTPGSGDLLVYNAATSTFENKIPSIVSKRSLSDHEALADPDEEMNFWGGFTPILTGGVVGIGVPETASNGCGKLMIVINAGANMVGDITITGDTRDRNTGAITSLNSEIITLAGPTVDTSDTDAEGNPRHAFSQAYMTTNWFQGPVTITTSVVDVSDFDIYNVGYHQFGDTPISVELDSLDVTAFNLDSANGWLYTYLYSFQRVNGHYDLVREASVEFSNAVVSTSVPQRTWRGKIGQIGKELDPVTDGMFVQMWPGPTAQLDWEDFSLVVVYSATEPLTLS